LSRLALASEMRRIYAGLIILCPVAAGLQTAVSRKMTGFL